MNFNPKVSRISGLQCERGGGGWNMSPSPPPFSRDHLETISSVSFAAPAWRAEPRKSQSRPLQQLHPFPEKRRRRRRRIGLGGPLDSKQLDFSSRIFASSEKVRSADPIFLSIIPVTIDISIPRATSRWLVRIYGRYKVPFFSRPRRSGGQHVRGRIDIPLGSRLVAVLGVGCTNCGRPRPPFRLGWRVCILQWGCNLIVLEVEAAYFK